MRTKPKLQICLMAVFLKEKGYSEGLCQGISRGKIEELKKNVNAIIRKKDYSLEEALDVLDVSEEDRKLFYITH